MYLDFLNEKIYYSFEDNSKPLVVFIHGLGGKAIYGEDFKKIDNRNYQILSFDLVGRGNSSYNNPITLQLWIDNIKAVLKELKIKKFYVLAHSFGCYLTANLLLDKDFEIIDSLLITPYNPFVKKECNFRQKILKIYPDNIDENTPLDKLLECYESVDKQILEEFEIFNFEIYRKDLQIMKKFTDQKFHDEKLLNDYNKATNFEIVAADNDLVVPYESMIELAKFKNKSPIVFNGGHDIIITHLKQISDLIEKMIMNKKW